MPKRTDMAQFAIRALQRNVRIAPTDHLVSEAIYLWDLDGNGIEITFETPWRGTLGDPESGSYATTTEGKPHSGREPIDLQQMLDELGPNPVLEPTMPAGTRIGHVHVHVNDLHSAMAFYRDGIGFGGLFLIRSFGMGDVGLDYTPHTIAFNIWSGPNAAQAPAGSAGLRWFTIVVPDETTLDDVRARLTAHHYGFDEIADGIEARDPSGNLVKIVTGLEVDRLGQGRGDVTRDFVGAEQAGDDLDRLGDDLRTHDGIDLGVLHALAHRDDVLGIDVDRAFGAVELHQLHAETPLPAKRPAHVTSAENPLTSAHAKL